MAGATKEQFTYDADARVSTKNSAILGRLEGPCADIVDATRNGRKYSDKLWENVFKNPIVKEYFECGGVFGELGHPTDREETDMSKIAICMPKPPTKGSDNLLYGSWDILDTPNGRILKCLCDYGYRIGISSRGSGDLEMDFDGNESVNPETYNFQAFDAVLLPAVKAARLDYVSESLNTSKKSLSAALTESINSANADEKKIMMETLDNLNISYNIEEYVDVDSKTEEAGNAGEDVIKDLQEALKKNKSLEDEIRRLQEKLSVCYTEETAWEDKEAKYRKAINGLSISAKRLPVLESKIKTLSKSIASKNAEIRATARQNNALNEQVRSFNEQLQSANESNARLTEELNRSNSRIQSLVSERNSLQESLNSLKSESNLRQQSLNESIATAKHDSKVKQARLSEQLTSATKLAEKYKRIAKTAVDKYIESQAIRIGVSASEIKSKLNEDYSFDDIDRICESLQSYKVSVAKLPINLSNNSRVSVKVTESKEPIKPTNKLIDDEVDAQLVSLANLNK